MGVLLGRGEAWRQEGGGKGVAGGEGKGAVITGRQHRADHDIEPGEAESRAMSFCSLSHDVTCPERE